MSHKGWHMPRVKIEAERHCLVLQRGWVQAGVEELAARMVCCKRDLACSELLCLIEPTSRAPWSLLLASVPGVASSSLEGPAAPRAERSLVLEGVASF